MLLADERAAVCEHARRMTEDGLVVGTSGNLSARAGEHVAVTPTGVDYATMRPEDVTVVALDGTVVEGERKPTSELPMHLSVYREAADPRGEPVGAVVHTHSAHATAVSTVVDEVPAVHYMLAAIGPTVRVAGYAPYGTDELAAAMLGALWGRRGCLLANHGAVTYAAGLPAAYTLARQLEWCCQVWLLARTAGQPSLLTPEQLADAADALAGYGQPRG